MRAGLKDRRITFQKETYVDDPGGGTIGTWEDLLTVWAEVIMEGGREVFAHQTIAGVQQAIFRTAWFAAADVTLRIMFQDRAWDVNAVREVGRREGLEFQTTWSS